MPLSDTVTRQAKPSAKPVRMFDGGGLYLEVSPVGSKLWRMKYRFDGKEKRLALGIYPYVSLKEARERREDARILLAHGKDPGEAKKAIKASVPGNTFEVVALQWFAAWSKGVGAAHGASVLARLRRDVFPWIGNVAVSNITASVVLDTLRKIEARGHTESAFRAKVSISQVMRYAIILGKAEIDPVPSLRGAFAPKPVKHMPAITSPTEVGDLLRSIKQYPGGYSVRAALMIAPYVFVRPGELRAARWADIDLGRAEWRYTVSKTKTDHIVPLARQVLEILRDLHKVTGGGGLVFPGMSHGKPISEVAINMALQRLGYDTKTEMTGHGFRAMARTLLAEELRYPAEVIEHQLAHKVPDVLGSAYNRTRFLDDRKRMMQDWADYLDRLRDMQA